MSLTALHAAPRPRTVVVEQLRSLAVALRKETWVFGIACLAFVALGLRAAFASIGSSHAYISIAFVPETAFPIAIMALFIPLSIWRAEDPSRRSYHWAMPLPRTLHTMLKVLAGLAWAFAAVAMYLACIGILSASIGVITGRWESYSASAWEWLVPFTSCVITYALGSAVAVGVRHPSRWLLGLIPALLMLYLFAQALNLQWLQDAFITTWQGEYGMATALGANLRDAAGHASYARWSIATLLWGIPALASLYLAARRHMEEN